MLARALARLLRLRDERRARELRHDRAGAIQDTAAALMPPPRWCCTCGDPIAPSTAGLDCAHCIEVVSDRAARA